MLDVSDVKKALSGLSKAELKEVLTAAKFLSGGKSIPEPKPASKITGDIQIFQGIMIFAKKYMSVPSSRLVNSGANNFTAMRERLNSISLEIREISDTLKCSRDECLKLCRAVVDAGVAELEAKEMPVSFTTLLYKISSPKSLLDNSYPGYMGPLFKRFVLNANADSLHTGKHHLTVSIQ